MLKFKTLRFLQNNTNNKFGLHKRKHKHMNSDKQKMKKKIINHKYVVLFFVKNTHNDFSI